jgi:hypothetical protein
MNNEIEGYLLVVRLELGFPAAFNGCDLQRSLPKEATTRI